MSRLHGFRSPTLIRFCLLKNFTGSFFSKLLVEVLEKQQTSWRRSSGHLLVWLLIWLLEEELWSALPAFHFCERSSNL